MKATWMLLAVAVVWICFPNASGATQIVTFGDSGVEGNVRWFLSIPEPTPITVDDMLLLTWLSAYADNGDFTGLEYARNLVQLSCSTETYPANLWPLADLPNLDSFHMDNSQLMDISALGGLTSLGQLYLRGNDISDITPLGGLTNLRHLYLKDNDISDITPLGGLENLSYLELMGNKITDISALGGLEDLWDLYITDNEISDISPLAGLPRLERLIAPHNSISDISSIGAMGGLTVLELGHNEISDISAIAAMGGLIVLRLEHNAISDISALADITIASWKASRPGCLDLRGNPLNQEAYDMYLPLIEANNPDALIYYDPIPEPMSLALVCVGGVLLRKRRRRQHA